MSLLKTGKGKIKGRNTAIAKTIKMIAIGISGIPVPVLSALNADRNVPAIIPIAIIKPRKMKPITAMNIAHFLVVLRFFRLFLSISIFLISGVGPIHLFVIYKLLRKSDMPCNQIPLYPFRRHSMNLDGKIFISSTLCIQTGILNIDARVIRSAPICPKLEAL